MQFHCYLFMIHLRNYLKQMYSTHQPRMALRSVLGGPCTFFIIKYFSDISKHFLLMLAFGCSAHCQELYSLMKNVKSGARTHLIDSNFISVYLS
jgi:hypothetical protein